MKRCEQIVRTILVVDDDPKWLDFLSRALGTDYPVLSAANGEDAVRRAQRACPDVIVLDVMMPGGRDGFAVFAELQNDPRTQNIPVLMLLEVNREAGLDFGAEEMNRYLGKAPAAFFEKPISAERLLDEVKKVLKGVSDQTEQPDSGQQAPLMRKKSIWIFSKLWEESPARLLRPSCRAVAREKQ